MEPRQRNQAIGKSIGAGVVWLRGWSLVYVCGFLALLFTSIYVSLKTQLEPCHCFVCLAIAMTGRLPVLNVVGD
jgi:hypothetical protein